MATIMRVIDLIPYFGTKLGMISAKERGSGYVEEQAHGSADDRGVSVLLKKTGLHSLVKLAHPPAQSGDKAARTAMKLLRDGRFQK